MIGKPALQSKPKKRLMGGGGRGDKTSILLQFITHFNLIISWGACSQSASPLKPIWDSRCIDSIIVILYTPPPSKKEKKIIIIKTKQKITDSPTHDLAAYSFSSSWKPGTFLCVTADIYYKKLMLMPPIYADIKVLL